MEILLTLPYPISANRYWRTRVIVPRNRKLAPFVSTYLSDEAKQYKIMVGTLFLAKRLPKIKGKVDMEWWLYPHRPLDWKKRQERDYQNWDLTVQRLDRDNVNKVLSDALKNIAFEDDKMVMNGFDHIMEPDGKGARIVVSIQPTEAKPPQEGLFA